MSNSKIPFVKAVKVGNFRLWRVRKDVVDCICVGNADGTWCVRVPSTFEMYAVLNALYDDYLSPYGSVSERGGTVLDTILSNMMYATVVGNGYFHQALMHIATAYANPSFLDSDDEHHDAFFGSFSRLLDDFRAWCEKYRTDIPSIVNDGQNASAEDTYDKVEKYLKEGSGGLESEPQ